MIFGCNARVLDGDWIGIFVVAPVLADAVFKIGEKKQKGVWEWSFFSLLMEDGRNLLVSWKNWWLVAMVEYFLFSFFFFPFCFFAFVLGCLFFYFSSFASELELNLKILMIE